MTTGPVQRTSEELVVESAERQRVTDYSVGRAGSPSRLIPGCQPSEGRLGDPPLPHRLQSRKLHPDFFRRSQRCRYLC